VYTKSLVALRHYIVELKKQVLPKFFKPRVHNMYSLNLLYSVILESSRGFRIRDVTERLLFECLCDIYSSLSPIFIINC